MKTAGSSSGCLAQTGEGFSGKLFIFFHITSPESLNITAKGVSTDRTCPKCGEGNRSDSWNIFVPILWLFRPCGCSRRTKIALAVKVVWGEVAEKRLKAAAHLGEMGD